ncbi:MULTISPECIES: autotransporter outer membrane beta-barrel domain-containing protein [Vibrio]|uniref:Autotransporter outer membrane beta-barrel domain-containing protein n=2 Tax=Vibrio TaxID=662 RepID=A0A7X4LQI9_9VIBR|nr:MULTISPECIES: autotransporter outer membrane beta-barrel domain-containing protein [Vibrio]MBF9000053.1 autotransporter outer membrane beta-barrel domain-containing protein [Vibrio nitrifigilis]MZI95791.1 autotransporter outer membrane beta-barrel domain-containing protein [Vibrio eleionomae]
MRKTMIAAMLLLVSSYSMAETDPDSSASMSNFSYDYIEARIGVSPVTYGAGFSMSIHPNAHFVGRIDSKFDGDFDSATGLGFHAPINNWSDLTGAMLLRVQDKKHQNSADAGMELNLGIRQWLGPQLEVGGNAGYVSIDDKDDWTGSVYARFHSTELFSLGAEMRFNDFYDDQLMFTARFKY